MIQFACGRPLGPAPTSWGWLLAEGVYLARGSRAMAAYSPSQKELIEQATAASLANVGQYTDELLAQSLATLNQAAQAVHASVLSLGDLSQFTRTQLPGKQVELARLKAVELQITQMGARLKKDMSLVYKGMSETMAKEGIKGVVAKLGALKLPGYKDLGPGSLEDIAAGAFSLVNSQAFDFLAGYQLQLLGKLSDDLVAGIKQAISVGIVQGQGPAVIARNIGGIVTDPAEFKRAGKTVFRSVQQRAELIARSETMRAYNQGALKFEQQIGVTKLIWLTAGDERTCPECGPLDGKEYPILSLPSQPLHPACRCTHVPGATNLKDIQGLPGLQEAIEKNTLAQQTVKDAIAQKDYGKLSVLQLRELSKSRGLAVTQTMAERKAYLAEVFDVPLSKVDSLTPEKLDDLLKQLKISHLKSKEQLVQGLVKADAAADAAKLAALEAAKKAAQEAAEKALKEAQLAAAKAQAVEQANTAFAQKLSAVQAAANPADYTAYHAARGQLIAQIEGVQDIVGQVRFQQMAKDLATVTNAYHHQVETMTLQGMREILKTNKVKHYAGYSKQQLQDFLRYPAQHAQLAEQVAAKVKASQDAYKLAKPAKPVKVAPAPAPTKSVLTLAQEADQKWEQIQKQAAFTFDGNAKGLGGAHSKFYFRDAEGNRWLYKPIGEEFRAWGDEVAYRIAREIDPGAVEARYIELPVNGQATKGSLQRMKTGLATEKDYDGFDLTQLGQAELSQLQREHVIDWLIANHDGHTAQFLRGVDGSVTGIDKGQLFKFLGKDSLSIDYYPNRTHNAGEPIYNQLMRLYQQGKLKIDLEATGEFIRRTELITDAAYREMLRPYAERRFAGQPGALADFYTLALKRKNSLRADFEKFYSQIETGRTGKPVTFRFGKTGQRPAAGAPTPREVLARDARVDLQQEAKDIAVNGWQGKSIPVDKHQIEDQNLLVQERLVPGGGRQTVMRLRLRPEADRDLQRLLTGGKSDEPKVPIVDSYWHRILSGIKTTAHHAAQGSKDVNGTSIAAMLQARTELTALLKSKELVERQMAAYYIKIVDEIAVLAEKAKLGQAGLVIPKVEQFDLIKALEKANPVKAITFDGFKVKTRSRWTEDLVETRGSDVILVKENQPLSTFYKGIGRNAVEYEINLGDGVVAVYKPFDTVTDSYALQGRMTVRAQGPATADTIAKALTKLKKLGIDADVATAVDEELMYLQKVAYVATVDTTPAFTAAAKQAATAVSPEDAVRIWRDTWSKHLGVPDVTKLPEYDPRGAFQMSTTGKGSGGGLRAQFRFDLPRAEFEKFKKDYVLTHEIHSSTIPDFFDLVLSTNKSFVPTADRFSSGVPIGGMSPIQDMDTGGASYFFTRIRKRTEVQGNRIVLKPELVRRADAISYPGDRFGRVHGDVIRTERAKTVEDLKRYSGGQSNETIFKGSVTILDNLEHVQLSSQAEKKHLIDVFKKHGITVLPDGRKVEDAIVVKGW